MKLSQTKPVAIEVASEQSENLQLKVGSKNPVCFVAMPIRPKEHPDHAHFRDLYEHFIRAPISALGYDVVRSDEIQKSGAITREVINHLANSALVIADLTDLNANVFYELGVRHALLGHGTIMIIDTSRTPTIPFDIHAYRVIPFEPTMSGLGQLQSKLAAFVTVARETPQAARDNPVHDALPVLPARVVDVAMTSDSAALRAEVASLKKQLDRLQSSAAIVGSDPSDSVDAIRQALEEAQTGTSPMVLLKDAHDAMTAGDQTKFLEIVYSAVQRRSLRLSSDSWIELVQFATMLGMSEISGHVLDFACDLYPSDSNLRRARLQHLAHSQLTDDRARAKSELAKEVGLQFGDDGPKLPDSLSRTDFTDLALLLDIFYREDLHEEALAITRPLVAKNPRACISNMVHARVLCSLRQDAEGLEYHRRAIMCPDADDEAIRWYANELHNRGRRADACEVYLLACTYDPSDPNLFSHAADEMSALVTQRRSAEDDQRSLPSGITTDDVKSLVCASLGCNAARQDIFIRCRDACRRVSIDLAEVQVAVQNEPGFLAASGRRGIAEHLYGRFRTSITHPDASEVRPSGSSPKSGESALGS